MSRTEKEFAIEVVQKLQNKGFQALFAGGCVRDQLLGLEPQDYDIATDAKPDQVCELFPKTIQVGMAFGVVEVLGKNRSVANLSKTKPSPFRIQVATFREDGEYLDGRRPENVRFSNAEADAKRRDFTINGMFYDPIHDQILDFVGGKKDLKSKIIRAIGCPEERFQEDKLRLMRAVRMSCRFQFQLEEQTRSAIQRFAPQISLVSQERISDELKKILLHSTRAQGYSLLDQLGLLQEIFSDPKILGPINHSNQETPAFPKSASQKHVYQALSNLDKYLELFKVPISYPLALAALFHTITEVPISKDSHFPEAEIYADLAGSKLIRKLSAQLKLSNIDTDELQWLMKYRYYFRNANSLPINRLKMIMESPKTPELFVLASSISTEEREFLQGIEYAINFWNANTQNNHKLVNPPPLIAGSHLISLGFAPGPDFKRILDRIRDEQLEGIITTFEQALEESRKLIKDIQLAKLKKL